MIEVVSVYNDVVKRVNKTENGEFTYSSFNRISWIAQLRLMDYLTGSLSGMEQLEAQAGQKGKDFVTPFFKQSIRNVSDGFIEKPSDFYIFESLFKVGEAAQDCDCEGNAMKPYVSRINIPLLPTEEFNKRLSTYITLLQPSVSRPVAKIANNGYVLSPKEIGAVGLDYIRLPKKAHIATKIDTDYNEEVPDLPNCINFEWDEAVRPHLVWFICDDFFNSVRENAGKQFNQATVKPARL